MNRVLVQASKEWSELRRDPLSMALAILLPLATLLLFGYGVRMRIENIPVIVENFDTCSLSRSFVERLYATNALVPGSWKGERSLEGAIEAGGAKVAIVIPEEFSHDIAMGRTAFVQTLIDGSDVNTAHVLHGIIRGVELFFSNMVAAPDVRALHVVPTVRVWFNPGGKESLFVVPGVFAIVLWMYPSLLAAVAASREVEQRTIVQVYASSLKAGELLLGKGLVCFAVGLCEALVIMLVGWLLFGVTIVGDPTLLLVATPIYICASVLFGLTIGSYANSQTIAVQATSTGGFFPTLLLSGFIYPLNNIPFPLTLFSLIVPARYYITVTRDVFVRGTGWSSLWWAPLVLLMFAAIYFVISWYGLRRMQVKD